jgi:hypothetical protein
LGYIPWSEAIELASLWGVSIKDCLKKRRVNEVIPSSLVVFHIVAILGIADKLYHSIELKHMVYVWGISLLFGLIKHPRSKRAMRWGSLL